MHLKKCVYLKMFNLSFEINLWKKYLNAYIFRDVAKGVIHKKYLALIF